MKVLFLDIDGVLNYDGCKDTIPDGPWKGMYGVSKPLVDLYLDWRIQRDIEVVLSSTWRKHPELYQYLHNNGIYWMDVTPFFPKLEREHEIQHWLEEHTEVTHFAVLDDLQVRIKNLVQTSPRKGLTLKQIHKLDKVLGYDKETIND